FSKNVNASVHPRPDSSISSIGTDASTLKTPAGSAGRGRYNAPLRNQIVVENLRYRPIRTFLSVLAIGIEVTMILTLVGISYGTLDEAARRARGVGADILVRPPGAAVMSLSTSPMGQDFLPFFMKQRHVTFATGTMIQPLSGFDTLTGVDLA